MTDKSLDQLIAEVARENAAESFGPHFADRVVASSRQQPAVRPALRLVRWTAAAAAVVLALLLVDSTRTRAVTAGAGTFRAVQLSDGSEVTLAAGSTLSYRSFRLRSERMVRLTGEAFFDVATREKPFVVETFNGRVVVTGTRFNVRAWPSAAAPATEVALEEGAVRVEPVSSDGALVLKPGQSARLQGTALVLDERRSIPDALSWRSGGISLVDVPLADIADELSRRFDRRFELDALVRDRLATYVDPEQPSVEDVLDAICFALDLRYRPIQGGYRIEPAQTP